MNGSEDNLSAEGARGSPQKRPVPRVRVLALVIVLAVLIGLGVGLYKAIRAAREAAIAAVSQCPLNQLQLALVNYHHLHGCLLPAYIADEDGTPMHSWRVLILPFVDEQALYDAYNFDEPWNGPSNSKLFDKMPGTFHIRSEPFSTSVTNVVAIVGPGTAFPGPRTTRWKEFTDGRDNTILLAEIANSDIIWLEPRDLHVEQMSFTVNDESKPSISCSRRRGPYVVFADRIHVHRISASLRPETLKALTTIAGGEKLYMAEVWGIGLTSLTPGPATDANLQAMQDLGQLRSLWLNGSDVTDQALSRLAAASNLSKLNLSDTRITDEGLRHLKGLTELRKLNLSGTSLTDAGLEHLKGLAELRELNLSGTSITDAGLEHLTDIRYLILRDTGVTIRGVSRFLDKAPGADIKMSEGSVDDDRLDFHGSPVTDADIEHFGGLTGLYYVYLGETGITDASLPFLGTQTYLRWLDVSGTAITDEGLHHLSQTTKLAYLILADTQITDAGLDNLTKLTSLWKLDLSGTRVTDRGLERLQALANLFSLDLNETQVSDEGVKHLKRLPELRELGLRATRVTDSAMANLEEISGLKKLDLRDTKVSNDAVEALQKALPHCSIHR